MISNTLLKITEDPTTDQTLINHNDPAELEDTSVVEANLADLSEIIDFNVECSKSSETLKGGEKSTISNLQAISQEDLDFLLGNMYNDAALNNELSSNMKTQEMTQKNIMEHLPKEIESNVSQESSVYLSSQVSSPKELCQSSSKEMSQSTSKEMSQSTSKEMSQSTSKEMSQSTSKEMSQSTSKELSHFTFLSN